MYALIQKSQRYQWNQHIVCATNYYTILQMPHKKLLLKHRHNLHTRVLGTRRYSSFWYWCICNKSWKQSIAHDIMFAKELQRFIEDEDNGQRQIMAKDIVVTMMAVMQVPSAFQRCQKRKQSDHPLLLLLLLLHWPLPSGRSVPLWFLWIWPWTGREVLPCLDITFLGAFIRCSNISPVIGS